MVTSEKATFKTIKSITLLQAMVLAIVLNHSGLLAQGRIDQIAINGQAAPDGNGTLAAFISTRLNHAGQ